MNIKLDNGSEIDVPEPVHSPGDRAYWIETDTLVVVCRVVSHALKHQGGGNWRVRYAVVVSADSGPRENGIGYEAGHVLDNVLENDLLSPADYATLLVERLNCTLAAVAVEDRKLVLERIAGYAAVKKLALATNEEERTDENRHERREEHGGARS
jgi:hypothetical protein